MVNIEWRIDAHHGWAIEYPIITESDGSKYTPLGPSHRWLHSESCAQTDDLRDTAKS
jgi:hypothetical protein